MEGAGGMMIISVATSHSCEELRRCERYVICRITHWRVMITQYVIIHRRSALLREPRETAASSDLKQRFFFSFVG